MIFGITNLALKITDPWIIMGDLNEMLNSEDRIGGRATIGPSRVSLENFINDTGVINLGFAGNPGMAFARKRLDRALVNED